MAEHSALLGAQVHVWHGDAGAAAEPGGEPGAADLAILSGQERARCQRFVRQADRVRFAAGHAGARRLLAGYLDVAPAAIRLGRAPCCRCGSAEHGPPRIDWPRTDITFNQSGSGDHWLLAISRGRRVGVDIELPRDVDVGDLAGSCLTAAERRYLDDQPDCDRLRLFYRCWTRKEAVLKACGVGLAGALSELDVAPGQDGPAQVRLSCAAGPDLWAVQDVPWPAGPAGADPQPPGPTWVGAVAQPASGSRPVVTRSAAGR